MEKKGRLLVVDFGRLPSKGRGFLAHLHRHGRVDLSDLVGLSTAAGLDVGDRVGVRLVSVNVERGFIDFERTS